MFRIRPPTEEDQNFLIGPMAALGALAVSAESASSLYFPNEKIELDRYNVKSVRLFLEWLRDQNPGPCTEEDYTVKEPTSRQVRCQLRRDWDQNKPIGVRWNIYTCDTLDGQKIKKVVTPLPPDKNLVDQGAKPSGVVFLM